MRRKFDAVVFDLDGTLVDTAPDLHAHLNELLADLGRPTLPLAEVRPLIGDGARAMIWEGLATSGGLPADTSLDDLFARYLKRYTADPHRHGAPFEGVTEALHALGAAGTRLGVCTNKTQAPTERLLDLLGLTPHFGAIAGSDRLSVRKPDPGHLDWVIRELGAERAGAVLIGDSDTDLKTARAAGVPCILVSFGYTRTPAADLGADAVIDHFSELLPALARLAAAPA